MRSNHESEQHMSQMINKISVLKFMENFPSASQALVKLLISDDEDPDPTFTFYSVKGYNGIFVAEPNQASGPREPAFIWDGTSWFTSEDANEEQTLLGQKLSSLSPGGIGGF